MAGPWEKYGAAKASGPWAKYGATQQPQEATPEPQPEGPSILSTIGDVAASGAAGIGRGAMDLIGLPGTIANGMNSAGQWGLRKGYELATGEEPQKGTFFGGPSDEVLAAMPNQGRNMLSGSVLKEGLADKTLGGSDYQPKTVPGEYARTAGEFVPGAVAFGGMNIPNMIRSALLPAAGSETAGQLTKDTALEPYARIAGALLGGMRGGAVTRSAAPELPTAASIKASAGYADLKAPMKAAQITPTTYKSIVDDLWSEANDFGLTTKLKSEFGGALDDFSKRAEEQGGASLYDLELLRRSIRNAAGDKLDDASQALSAKLIGKLDDQVDNLSDANIAASGETGTPVVDVLKDARQTYRVGVKSQYIENAVEKAKNAASGFENGLRTEFRKLVNNPKMARNFNETEQAAIQSVVRGTPTSNALRWLGGFGVPLDNGRNFLGSIIGGSTGASIGSALGGPVGAAIGGPLLVGLGTAAKAGANSATRNQALIAEALVKAGPKAGEIFSEALAGSKQASREAIMRALMQSIQAPGQAASAQAMPR
jgi:plasmid stabilization system protein ParE